MYSISIKVYKILKLASNEGSFYEFKAILQKYTDSQPKRIIIIPYLSRGPSLQEKDFTNDPDRLIQYRLFDSPNKEGKMMPGRISNINVKKPHLVVSLHCAGSHPREYVGINPVLAPSYDFLYKGLLYLQNKNDNTSFFTGPLADGWKNEDGSRIQFNWFLSDTSLYFTGFPLDKSLNTIHHQFKGYYHNMVNWKYKDFYYWEDNTKHNTDNTQYSKTIKTFVPSGSYWEREQSIFERYKRKGGGEGFGGDNAYASYEIIRYIIYSLNMNNFDHKRLKPGKSYVNVWAIPLHVNAINAYIELGYFNNRHDRTMLLKHQDEIAEGIAVGIYSIFTGITIKKRPFKYLPKGKKIDLEKYMINDTKNYFSEVIK